MSVDAGDIFLNVCVDIVKKCFERGSLVHHLSEILCVIFSSWQHSMFISIVRAVQSPKIK